MTRRKTKCALQSRQSLIIVAEKMGYTIFENLYSGGSDLDLFLLVKPKTDLNSTFKAFDLDLLNIVTVNGWAYVVANDAAAAT